MVAFMSLVTNVNQVQQYNIQLGNYYRALANAYYWKSQYPNASSETLRVAGIHARDFQDLQNKSVTYGVLMGSMVGSIIPLVGGNKFLYRILGKGLKNPTISTLLLPVLLCQTVGMLVGGVLPIALKGVKTIQLKRRLKEESRSSLN